jgi:hypothetical protein
MLISEERCFARSVIVPGVVALCTVRRVVPRITPRISCVQWSVARTMNRAVPHWEG